MSTLKENAKNVSDADPYVVNVRAIVEDGHLLPSIAGRLKISALDGSDKHPQDSVDVLLVPLGHRVALFVNF